jgi:hypothetical protein
LPCRPTVLPARCPAGPFSCWPVLLLARGPFGTSPMGSGEEGGRRNQTSSHLPGDRFLGPTTPSRESFHRHEGLCLDPSPIRVLRVPETEPRSPVGSALQALHGGIGVDGSALRIRHRGICMAGWAGAGLGARHCPFLPLKALTGSEGAESGKPGGRRGAAFRTSPGASAACTRSPWVRQSSEAAAGRQKACQSPEKPPGILEIEA